MTLLLVGDIGGTKTTLQLLEVQGNDLKREALYKNDYSNGAYPDLLPMVKRFLEEVPKPEGYFYVPQKACFAVPGPVVNDESNPTNVRRWFLDARLLERELGIEQIRLINDFEAIGYGVLGLNSSANQDLHTLQAGNPQAVVGKTSEDTLIAVIGAGTGLGEGFLVRHREKYHVYASEGGHADFAPRNQREFDIMQDLKRRHKKLERVSVERVVSGPGIVAIYQFLRDQQFASESSDIAEVVSTWEQELKEQDEKTVNAPAEIAQATLTVDAPAEIAQAALMKRDHLCQETMKIFIEAYGAEVGNLALKLLPYQGIYLAGNIAARIVPLMTKEEIFLNSFKQKGRMSKLLEQMPVYIVLNREVGLIGTAIFAAQL